jgi:large subunit ribosomal protein L13
VQLKTYTLREKDIERQWHVIDAAGQTLGKLATQVAGLLMGKHKPVFSPNLDGGDYVIVVNAEKVAVTGNKPKQKMYYRHSGYPAGFRSYPLEKVMQDNPTRVVEHAVKGMLPRTRLGARMLQKLKVYAGESHPHLSQAGAPAGKAKRGEKGAG